MCRLKQDRHIATRTIQVWLNDLQREAGRNGCIERIAPSLQYRHRKGGRQPVGGGRHTKCAANFRSGGELGHGSRNASPLLGHKLGSLLYEIEH